MNTRKVERVAENDADNNENNSKIIERDAEPEIKEEVYHVDEFEAKNITADPLGHLTTQILDQILGTFEQQLWEI